MKKILLLCMTLALLFLLVKVIVLLLQNRFVFFPFKEYPATPAQLGLPAEDVFFTTADGVKLHGWYLPGAPGGPVVLYFHGNGGNIAYCLEFAQRMQPLGWSWFMPDYRGYGQSEGRPTEAGLYRDGEAALRVVRERFCPEPERLVMWGFSIGNVPAAYLAGREPAACLVLEAPFFNAQSMAAENPLLQVLFYFSSLELDNSAHIRGCQLPKLFVHGTQDQIVPFDQSQALYRLAPPPKEFYPVPEADHNNIFLVGGDAYRETVARFVNAHVAAARGTRTPGAVP
jgi:hypothetical protein